MKAGEVFLEGEASFTVYTVNVKRRDGFIELQLGPFHFTMPLELARRLYMLLDRECWEGVRL